MTAAWMLYGAYGFTGKLIAEEAVRRGHRPVLAGRDAARLGPLAEGLGLPHVVLGLDDDRALERAVADVPLVLHAAGPFSRTSGPMLGACLARGAHYLDITGEIPVFANTFRHGPRAEEKGVALISGVGFDVVPTDCLARYVADAVPGATRLDLAVAAIGRPSAGTARTAVEILARGGLVRRAGALVPFPLGEGARTFRFPHRELWAMPFPWADLETAAHTTGIPDITVYLAYPPKTIAGIRRTARWAQAALSIPPVRRVAEAVAGRASRGPDPEMQRTGRSYVWARAEGPRGVKEAWLETGEGYRFTAEASVRIVEKVLEASPRGALTPAMAFGADLVLEVPDTRRYDALPPD